MDRTIVIGHVYCYSIQFDVRGSYRTTWKRYNRRPPSDSTGYLDFDCAVTAECHSYNVRGTTWYNMWTSSITHSSPSQPTSTSSCRDEWRRPAAQQTVVGNQASHTIIRCCQSFLGIDIDVNLNLTASSAAFYPCGPRDGSCPMFCL